MRVKIIYDKVQIVMPIAQISDPVGTFLQHINVRLQAYLGDRTVRVKELFTGDGFWLNPRDLISDVLCDGDVLVAKSYAAWVQDNLDLLEKPEQTVSRFDYATWPSAYYTVDVGKHKHNKLYFKIATYKGEVHRLEVLDEESLSSYGKDGKHLVTRYQDKNEEKGTDWGAELYFIVRKDVVIGLEVQLKATSDVRPEIVSFEIDAKQLSVGSPKVLQTAALPKPNKVYTIPKPTKEGPSFDVKDFVPSDQEPSGIPKEDLEMSVEVVGSGNAGLEIKQKDPILADQSWFSKDEGGFDNMFLNNLALFNPTEGEIVVTKIVSEYQGEDGQWHAAKTRCGDKGGYYRYSMYGPDPDEGFNMEANQRMNLAILSTVFVKAPNYEKNRRAHRSLPNPLRIKITFITKDGSKSEIITEYKNKPLYLATKESVETKTKHQTSFWLQVDDIPAEARIWAAVSREIQDEEEILSINTSSSNANMWLRKKDLAKYIYTATKEGNPEVLLDSCSSKAEKEGYSIQVHGLVDIEHQYLYALKFDLSTNSSSASETYLIPDDIWN